jgi:hypothetical protein
MWHLGLYPGWLTLWGSLLEYLTQLMICRPDSAFIDFLADLEFFSRIFLFHHTFNVDWLFGDRLLVSIQSTMAWLCRMKRWTCCQLCYDISQPACVNSLAVYAHTHNFNFCNIYNYTPCAQNLIPGEIPYWRYDAVVVLCHSASDQ